MAQQTRRSPPPKPQPSWPIKTFKQPTPAPRPPSPAAKQLVDQVKRIGKNPPGIDPRQMRY
jgi:hypothetical protein